MIDHPTPDDDSVAVLLSGGMDSATLYYEMLYAGWKVLPICIDYGQRHARELQAATQLVERARVRWPALALPRVTLDSARLAVRSKAPARPTRSWPSPTATMPTTT